MNFEILLILLLVAIVCVIPGIYLSLKNMAMITDAISHTILLGIVIGFFISQNMNSPLLVICAVLTGLLTTFLINVLANNKKVKEDSAIAIVFPLLFAIAIILIALYADNIHLDIDSVLLGEVIFAPLERMDILGYSIPTSIVSISSILVINLLFITIFNKELTLYSFDEGFTKLSGFRPYIISNLLMIVVSITSVVSFSSVGSILVIGLMIGPVMTARLFVVSIKELIILSVTISIFSVTGGYLLATIFDVSLAGMIATSIGLLFILAGLFSPKYGIIKTKIDHAHRKQRFEKDLFLMHLKTHDGECDYNVEAGLFTMKDHLKWNTKKYQKVFNFLMEKNYIVLKDNVIYLTNDGKKYVEKIFDNYDIKML